MTRLIIIALLVASAAGGESILVGKTPDSTKVVTMHRINKPHPMGFILDSELVCCKSYPVDYGDVHAIGDTMGLYWQIDTIYVYNGDVHAIGDTMGLYWQIDTIYVDYGDVHAIGDTMGLYWQIDTIYVYPVVPVVKCDTVRWIRYYYGQTPEGTRIFDLRDNQDVDAEIYRRPVIHCDTIYPDPGKRGKK
jgi:sporulation protein YlmC with PRC-barrel domain